MIIIKQRGSLILIEESLSPDADGANFHRTALKYPKDGVYEWLDFKSSVIFPLGNSCRASPAIWRQVGVEYPFKIVSGVSAVVSDSAIPVFLELSPNLEITEYIIDSRSEPSTSAGKDEIWTIKPAKRLVTNLRTSDQVIWCDSLGISREVNNILSHVRLGPRVILKELRDRGVLINRTVLFHVVDLYDFLGEVLTPEMLHTVIIENTTTHISTYGGSYELGIDEVRPFSFNEIKRRTSPHKPKARLRQLTPVGDPYEQ